jgi:electron transfer flavoprotein-quinone oxidoreductase
MGQLKPTPYADTSAIAENDRVASLADGLVRSPLGKVGMKLADRMGLVEWGFNSPAVMAMMPDVRTSYVTVPEVLAETTGDRVTDENPVEPPELDDRIGDLTYDTDVGNPHIEVLDNSWEASGTAVTACPVSAKDFGGGCYRAETVQRDGKEETVVSLDTQPCVECGTCAVIADTHWEHPRGGKGVEYRQG